MAVSRSEASDVVISYAVMAASLTMLSFAMDEQTDLERGLIYDGSNGKPEY